MKSKENSLGSPDNHIQRQNELSPGENSEAIIAVNNFITLYNSRANFFSAHFIKKLTDGNRKALAELTKHPLPPTPMDLRKEFSKCIQLNVPDMFLFSMKDGNLFSMEELRILVPKWSSIAESVLMKSDPALADKLMSPAQWNAKAAFEVTFLHAMNELKEVKKSKKPNVTFEHYVKWVINPLEKAIEHVKEINPPGNCLVGYGDRVSLSDALKISEGFRNEFRKIVK